MIGFHSVMLRPDSVRRVRPPITMIPKTRAEHPKSQIGRERGIVRTSGFSVDELDPLAAALALTPVALVER